MVDEVFRAQIESKLVDLQNPTTLSIDGTAQEPFVDAAIRAQLAADSALDPASVPTPRSYESGYCLNYIHKDGDPWVFPAQIALPDDTPFATVYQFFGDDLAANPPVLRLERVGGRGGDGFYPATVVIDVVRAAAEIYGIYVGGCELAKFAARHRQQVPFAAVKRWGRTGTPDDELLEWVQRWGQVSPQELAACSMSMRVAVLACSRRRVTAA